MRMARVVQIMLAILVLTASLAARAEFAFDAKLGWDGRIRNGRWNPVVVTLQNSAPVPVDLELYAPRDSSQATLIRRAAIAGPVAQTYILYSPLVVASEPIILKVIDSNSRKTLGESKLFDPDRRTYGTGDYAGEVYVHQNNLFIGVSGIEPALKELGSSSADSKSTVGYLKPAWLPQAAEGLDALDLLVLNQPDLNTLEPSQKKAMLDWVRAGGRVMVWFGAAPLPPDDPITQALPCMVGDYTTIQVQRGELVSAGLPDRFGKLGGRILVPGLGATVTNVLGGGGAKVVSRRYGFGEIAVLSFDGSAMLFRDNRDAGRFWEPLLRLSNRSGSRTRTGSNESAVNGESASRVMDLLGGVPGVGTFGFAYVAVTLIALMLIVGPIDWLVLRWLGRQPWTWVTTTGWIALVTVGAIYIGQLVRSGDLHLRSLRIVDQADGVVVARNDVVGIYSPRTAEYGLEPSPNSWWQPLTGETNGYYGSSDRVVKVLACRQNVRDTVRETIPDPQDPMTIPVWNLRFLRGETIEKAEPLIEAKLEIHPDPTRSALRTDKYDRLVGTITNRSDTAITRIGIEARGHYIDGSDPGGRAPGDKIATSIPPHATVSIDLPVKSFTDLRSLRTSWNDYNQLSSESELVFSPEEVMGLATTLLVDRTRRIHELVPSWAKLPSSGEEDLACVYALMESPPAAATLKGRQPIEKNWVVVRALVKLGAPAAE